MRFLAAAFLAACCAACQQTRTHSQSNSTIAAKNGESFTLRLSEFEESLYCFQTTQPALDATPRWTTNADFPPLSPRKALAAALKEARRLRPDVMAWNLERISVEPHGVDGCWIYIVTLWRGDIAIAGVPFFLDVPVLMNGEAVHAVKNPR